jgi:predicted RNase H-like nuclease (RuvC/YqgF family)
LSTLTKVLIFVLSVSSLFLCGIVATYVISAEDFHKTAKEAQGQLQSAKQNRDRAEKDLENKIKEAKNEDDKLNAQIVALGTQITKLQGDLDTAKRENSQLVQQGASLSAAVQAANTGEKEQRAFFQQEHQKVLALEGDRINREKELTETSEALLQKVTVIAQLQDTVRQLTQENQELGTRLNQYLVQYGKIASKPPTTVAPGSPTARPVAAIAKDIALNGQVMQVDLQNRLVQISIGTAAGVRQDMVFHLIRGDHYVADIRVMEVTPDQAVGILDVVKEGMQPQAGDKVSTNL